MLVFLLATGCTLLVLLRKQALSNIKMRCFIFHWNKAKSTRWMERSFIPRRMLRRFHSLEFILNIISETLHHGLLCFDIGHLTFDLRYIWHRFVLYWFVVVSQIKVCFLIESAIVGFSKCIVPYLLWNGAVIILDRFAQYLSLLLSLVVDVTLMHHADSFEMMPCCQRLSLQFNHLVNVSS